MSVESVAKQDAEFGPRNPVALVRTYARRSDPAIRRNAAAALVAIGGVEAVDALVDMALAEADPEVLRETEEMLLGLDADPTSPVRQRLHARLAAGPTPNVTALVGRLRLRGMDWNDKEVTRILVDMAIEESPVQRAAEQALALLTDSARGLALEELRQRLNGTNARACVSTYALLGRLRMRHAPVAAPHLYGYGGGQTQATSGSRWKGLVHRCRLAAAIARRPAAAATRQLSFSFAWLTFGVTGLAGIIVATYLARTMRPEPPDGFFPVQLLVTPVLGLCLGVLATRRATPTYTQFDRLAAAVGEVAYAGLWALGPVFIAFGMLLLLLSPSGGVASWATLLLVGTGTAVALVAAVRLGTVVGFDALVRPDCGTRQHERRTIDSSAEPRRWRSRRSALNALVQVGVGTACGLVVLGGLLVVFRRYVSPEPGTSLARLIEGLWVFLLPSAAGVAAAFAAIDWTGRVGQGDNGDSDAPVPSSDRTSAPRTRLFDRNVVQWTACLSLIMFLALVLAAGVIRSAWGSAARTDIAGPRQSAAIDRWLMTVPASVDFRVAFLQKVRIEIPRQSDASAPPLADQPDLTLTLYEWHATELSSEGGPICEGRTSRKEIASGDDPAVIEEWLGWGCYSVEVQSLSGDLPSGVLMSTSAALDIRAWQGVNASNADARPFDPDGLYTVRTALNIDSDAGEIVRDGLSAMSAAGRVQILETLPAQYALNVQEPVELLALASPTSDVEPAGDKTADATKTAADATRADPAAVGREIILWLVSDTGRQDPGDGRVKGPLAPGRHVLHAARRDGQALASRFMTLNILLEPLAFGPIVSSFSEFSPDMRPEAPKGQTVAGYWRVSALPATHQFAIAFPQRVRATIPSSEIPGSRLDTPISPTPYDVTLGLKGDTMDPRVNDGDPEIIEVLLEPGIYTLEVLKRNSDGTEVVPPLSPPLILELQLNVDKVGAGQ